MYRVVKIESFLRTQKVTLKNLNTNTIDICFDDSRVVSKEKSNEFMYHIGKKYDCKILIIGDISDENDKEATSLYVLSEEKIGKKPMIKVSNEKDEYYISKCQNESLKIGTRFFYKIIRKDLIQVDKTIHNDYLQ